MNKITKEVKKIEKKTSKTKKKMKKAKKLSKQTQIYFVKTYTITLILFGCIQSTTLKYKTLI